MDGTGSDDSFPFFSCPLLLFLDIYIYCIYICFFSPKDMQAHYRGYGSVAGCYSPCLKLTDPKWNNSASKGVGIDWLD